MAAQPSETLRISDGTTMEIVRIPGVDDATWEEVKAYVEGSPDTAKSLRKFAKNPEAVRGFLQMQAIAEHYNTRLESGDAPVQDRIRSLETDPDLVHIFEDIKKNGPEAAMMRCQDEELMVMFSRKMGGLQQTFATHEGTPLTLHEAASSGNLSAVQEFLGKQKPLDAQDSKGVTPLGCAIGANRIAVVKLLVTGRANLFAVDSSGNSGLHYAAGYGRKELVEYLVSAGASVHQTNAQGETPLNVAMQNRQDAAIEVLKALGAK